MKSDNLEISVPPYKAGGKLKLVICGSPQWTFDKYVRDQIDLARNDSELKGKRLLVIHGGEPGPETVAQNYCRERGIDTIIQEAVKRRGQDSYFRRNELILNYHKPDLIICFAISFRENSIAADIVSRAEAKGIKVKQIDYQFIVKSNTLEIPVTGFVNGLP